MTYVDERRGFLGVPAWIVSSVALVAANLVPIGAVLAGRAALGDVFMVYWMENLVVWLVTIVKIATATAPLTLGDTHEGAEPTATWAGKSTSISPRFHTLAAVGLAAFFSLHFGIFTAVHGAFSYLLGQLGGFHGSVSDWTLIAGALLLSHVISLVVNWFGVPRLGQTPERWSVSPQEAMIAPYPRMVVLHVAILATFFLLFATLGFDAVPGADTGLVRPLLGVTILCGLKIAVDLTLHLRERRRAAA